MANDLRASQKALEAAEQTAEYLLWKAYCYGAENGGPSREPLNRPQFREQFSRFIASLARLDLDHDWLSAIVAANSPVYATIFPPIPPEATKSAGKRSGAGMTGDIPPASLVDFICTRLSASFKERKPQRWLMGHLMKKLSGEPMHVFCWSPGLPPRGEWHECEMTEIGGKVRRYTFAQGQDGTIYWAEMTAET